MGISNNKKANIANLRRWKRDIRKYSNITAETVSLRAGDRI
jgi:hypothetical protein